MNNVLSTEQLRFWEENGFIESLQCIFLTISITYLIFTLIVAIVNNTIYAIITLGILIPISVNSHSILI